MFSVLNTIEDTKILSIGENTGNIFNGTSTLHTNTGK